jgi:mRNA interferase YafQ
MRNIIRSGLFSRQYKLMQRRHKDMSKIDQIIRALAFDEVLPASCRDHALSGSYSGFRDCHIEPDWLLIYAKGKDEAGGEKLYLEATGTHSDLF